MHFESSAARVLLGFAGGDFELYVTMAPGTSRADAVAACNRLCTWLRQEEPRLPAAAARGARETVSFTLALGSFRFHRGSVSGSSGHSRHSTQT